ncbi:MAG: alanine--tRNA ligase [Candidatus Woesearchaeota archaeon]
MIPDKEIKKKWKPIFWKDPDKYFPTEVLKQEGYSRGICRKCKKPFWSIDKKRTVCGDSACSEGAGFDFIGKSSAKKSLSYIEVWKEFAKMFEGFGYKPVDRYPTVCRWNPTMEYTNASIAAFQPFVINGEVDPPAEALVIPQFSIRFADIDNVGVTMSHNTGFVMIGQHMFVPPEKWDQNKVFRHIVRWFIDGLKIPKDELVFHEDAWAGGGNFGCCIEIFCRGNELANQVYMLFRQTDDEKGYRELDIKVLDMGLGMERNAWFSQGADTIYDATFPTVLEKLYKLTGFKKDRELFRKYVPWAGLLNLDETENIGEEWKKVAEKVGCSVDKLKEQILPLSGIYSIAEHSRTLLFALSDGALPSNVGGGYNLRMLARRAFDFIERFRWNIDLSDVCEWHAEYLKPIFPELQENLKEIREILAVEKKKYAETKKRNRAVIEKIIKKPVTAEKLVELYDSMGISPETVAEEAKKQGVKIDVPERFYAMIAEKHESAAAAQQQMQTATKKQIELDLNGMPDTTALYFDHYDLVDFDARVLKIIDNKYIILDRTCFYPTSGGQLNDIGTIGKDKITDVFKQGKIIVHAVEKKPGFSEGDIVACHIDFERRLQLTQHHTAAHIINGVCRKLLGNHIWQAGASKTTEKARLDITHYDNLTEKQTAEIEKNANTIIEQNLPVLKQFMPRNIAEKTYGFRLYQGGAVPGRDIRVVHIENLDAEACAGTHLNRTGECESIKIIKTSKIQDGVIRIEFVAGKAADSILGGESKAIAELRELLECSEKQIPARAEELFRIWKDVVKKKKDIPLKFTSTEEYNGNVLKKCIDILKTPQEHLATTIRRFKKETGMK